MGIGGDTLGHFLNPVKTRIRFTYPANRLAVTFTLPHRVQASLISPVRNGKINQFRFIIRNYEFIKVRI